MGEPKLRKVRAVDVQPYHWAVWCTVEGHFDAAGKLKPFANAIESRRWSEDGQSIWFLLGTHNFLKARPDEDLELVPQDAPHWVRPDETQEEFVAKRPTPTAPCPHCAGSGKVSA